jgi:hypothetical protein
MQSTPSNFADECDIAGTLSALVELTFMEDVPRHRNWTGCANS